MESNNTSENLVSLTSGQSGNELVTRKPWAKPSIESLDIYDTKLGGSTTPDIGVDS